MQQAQSLTSQPTPSRGGGRVSSPAYRRSLALCDDFTGLEGSVDRYSLLLLVKRVGKAAGFTPRMVILLDYYMAFTRECDWTEDNRPIVYQSQMRTALDLGVTERQIQHLERQLFEVGAVTFADSGNHRRFGQRDAETGAIRFAFGIDLTPLSYLKPELEAKLRTKQLADEAWQQTKRRISWHRRQIRGLLLEAGQREEGALSWQGFESRYEAMAGHIRTHQTLTDLQSLLQRHEDLLATMLNELPDVSFEPVSPELTEKPSSKDATLVGHKYTSTQEPTKSRPEAKGFQKSVAAPTDQADVIAASGLQHVSLAHVLQAASDRFREHLPVQPRPMNWQDVVEAASRLRPALHISQSSWSEACEVLGRTGAAIALLVTDQATLRDIQPVTKPAAYFRGLVNRGRTLDLRLHNSIFGLISRGAEPEK